MSVADYNKKNTFAYDYQAQIGDVRADLAKARGGATGGGDAKAVTTRNTITDGHIRNIKATPSLTQWRQDNPMATPQKFGGKSQELLQKLSKIMTRWIQLCRIELFRVFLKT